MKEKILTNTLKQHLNGKRKGIFDDWCWTGLSIGSFIVCLYLTYKFGINLSDGATSIATGMFALMSIGASSVLASAPRFIVIDLKNISTTEVNENLKYFISVQWVNLKAIMVSAIGTLAVAMANSGMNDISGLQQWQGYVASALPALVIIGIRRWWLLTTELLTMVIIYIENKNIEGSQNE